MAEFHTRTKTSRSKPLHDAAPQPYVQINANDAAQLNVKDGDEIIVRSRHGQVQVPAKLGDIEIGQVFSKNAFSVHPRNMLNARDSVPFHFGTWDADDRALGRAQAANELTRSAWVSNPRVSFVRGDQDHLLLRTQSANRYAVSNRFNRKWR